MTASEPSREQLYQAYRLSEYVKEYKHDLA
jgi:hypothetical protein